jgi:pinin
MKNNRNFDVPFSKRRADFNHKIFSRLGSKEEELDDFPKPKVSSRVITREQVPASRENALAMQSKNNDLARNKRMFGSLLGTLQRFRKEEDKGVQEKRAMIDMKIEKQQLLVKEQLKQEKDTLITDRRRKQLEIKSLEMKMFKLRTFKAWEDHKLALVNFIGTKSKPQIFYLPKTMTPATETLMKESHEELQQMILARRRAVDEEIKEIEERLRNDIQALEEGKLKKFDDETSDNPYSDNENNESSHEVVVKKEADESNGKLTLQQRLKFHSDSHLSPSADRKRKRSFSPEKALRSQVVVKKANH